MKLNHLIMAGLMAISTVGSAMASISISPQMVAFDAASKKRNETVTISNSSKEDKTYKISFINYIQDDNLGYSKATEETSEGVKFADKWLLLSPRQTTLKAGKSQTIRLQRKPMADAPDGEYVSHLLIEELPPPPSKVKQKVEEGKIGVEIKALINVSIPVILRKGELGNKFEFVKAEKIENKSSGQEEIKLSFKNESTKSLQGDIELKNSKGDIVGKYKGFRVYVSNKSPVLTVPLSKNITDKKLMLTIKDLENKKDVLSQEISL